MESPANRSRPEGLFGHLKSVGQACVELEERLLLGDSLTSAPLGVAFLGESESVKPPPGNVTQPSAVTK